MVRAKQLGLELAVASNARAARGGRRATRAEAQEMRAEAEAVKRGLRERWAGPPSAKRRITAWKRKGHKKPGRKPKGAMAGERHGVRPFLSPHHPVHVTLRVTREVGRLRRRSAYDAFRRAMIKTLARVNFRVVHVSIQANHVHLICEADDRIALSKGVRGLSISVAHRLNIAIGEDRGTARRKGRVFVDRYHAKVIDSPKMCRNELAYVLNNWRRHREDVVGWAQRRAKVDPYSSGVAFPGWAEVEAPFAWPRGYGPLPVSWPTTWLLTTGWRRWGPIGLREVPGPARSA